MAQKKKKGPAPRDKSKAQENPWTLTRIVVLIFSIIMLLALVIPTILQIFLYS